MGYVLAGLLIVVGVVLFVIGIPAMVDVLVIILGGGTAAASTLAEK